MYLRKVNMSVKMLSIAVFLLTLVFTQPVSAENLHPKGFTFTEFGITTGYTQGDLKDENEQDYEGFPVLLHFGYDINAWLGLENHRGTVQATFEPFLIPTINPEESISAGIELGFKYSYPVFERVSAYVDVGAGPMYFGTDTFEQGSAGFNFRDYGGGGLQFFFNNDKAVTLGYRFIHISDLDIGSSDNGGINSHSYFLGLSKFF